MATFPGNLHDEKGNSFKGKTLKIWGHTILKVTLALQVLFTGGEELFREPRPSRKQLHVEGDEKTEDVQQANQRYTTVIHCNKYVHARSRNWTEQQTTNSPNKLSREPRSWLSDSPHKLNRPHSRTPLSSKQWFQH